MEVHPTYLPSVPRIFEKIYTLVTSNGDPEQIKGAVGVGLKVRYEVGSAGEVHVTASAAAEVTEVARNEEDDMLAEAGSDTSETVRRDPEEAALELLQNELGARRIDGG